MIIYSCLLYTNYSYAELDALMVILLKVRESKSVFRSVRAGMQRESIRNESSCFGTGPSTSTPILAGGVKLKELKTKLQTASEGSPGRTLADKIEKKMGMQAPIIQTNPAWCCTRSFLSWDFPRVVPGCQDQPTCAPLGNLPPQDQERALIEELLYVMSGFDGDYIHALPLGSEVEERKFAVDDTADESLKEMLRRFFPVLACYSTIQRFYETRAGFDHGMVNDALAAAVGRLLHEYRTFVCQLESLLIANELSLQKAWYLIQPNVATLHQMHHITSSLIKAKSHGGQVTISLLYFVAHLIVLVLVQV